MNLLQLRKAFEDSWDITTTYSPEEWNTSNRAKGQCAVTSLYFADHMPEGTCKLFKGEVLLPDSTLIRHYWVEFWGILVDFTWRQFPEGSEILAHTIQETTREELLSNEWFKYRYELLKTKMDAKQ